MADLKISALPASTTPLAGTEILPIVQSATTRQVSVANLTAGRAVSVLSLTSTNDATINGITVGRGGGSVNLNTAVGASALAATSTGDANVAVGVSALSANLAGVGNTASGAGSLRDNTSGIYNVANGYLALATNLSGSGNIGVGYSVLSTGTATSNNTAIGYEALKVASGSTNTVIGYQSGVAMTTGTKNVILGSYSGNTGTLDIRTTNNNIVLSDGDGNVRAWWDNANARFYGTLLATGITNSALTSGRVTYAGTSGVLQDSASLTYNGTTLTASTGANFVTTSGSVGVGTASPVAKLQLGDGSSGQLKFRIHRGAGTDYTEYFSSGGDTVIDTVGGGDFRFVFSATEKVRITAAGNVGIGTSSPTSALLTLGSVNASNNTSLLANGTTTAYNLWTLSNTGGDLRIGIESATAVGILTGSSNYSACIGTLTANKLHLGSNSTVRATIDSAGFFGIGTTSPSAIFNVSSTGDGNRAIFDDTTNDNTLTVFSNATDIRISSLNNARSSFKRLGFQSNVMVFSASSGNESMRIDSSGRLLVGTTSPSTQTGNLEVFGSSSTTAMFKNTAGATSGWAGNFWNNATTGDNLFVEFGTETGYTGRGSVTYNRTGGLVVYNTTSDQRLKTNIVNSPSALSKINSIQIRSFDWIETENHINFGVIAQELEQVAPEAVTQGEDKEDGSIKRAWGVDTSVLVPAMIKAIQEQQALIESLTTRLTALENK